jgi:hypothetical protein
MFTGIAIIRPVAVVTSAILIPDGHEGRFHLTGRLDGGERLDHPPDRSEEAHQRRDGRDGREDHETALQEAELDLAGRRHRHLDAATHAPVAHLSQAGEENGRYRAWCALGHRYGFVEAPLTGELRNLAERIAGLPLRDREHIELGDDHAEPEQ